MGDAPYKIVRVITRLNIGGPALHVSLLSTRLDPRRFSTCLVIGESEPTEGDLSQVLEGRTRLFRLAGLRRSIRPWADASCWLRLLRVLWQERPRIIHTHMAKAGMLGRCAGAVYNAVGPGRRRGHRAVLIHTFHGHVLEGYFSPAVSKFFIIIERWLARHTDCLIAVSPRIRDDLLSKGIGRPEQWQVVRVGLELTRLAQVEQTDARESTIRIGLVGRLVPVKNPALFLRALQRVVSRTTTPHVQGMIVGDGPLRNQLEQEVKRLGLMQHVQFVGWQRELPAVYQGLDVVCLTSINEGTPVALIEAMAAARSVVSTDVGGVRDLLGDASEAPPGGIEPGRFCVAPRGILVRSGDTEGLAAGLERLAQDAGLRHRLGAAGRTYAVEVFSHERLLHDITQVYASMMQGSARMGNQTARRRRWRIVNTAKRPSVPRAAQHEGGMPTCTP